MPHRVVITGDLLRADPKGHCDQTSNITWFSDLFKNNIEALDFQVDVLGDREGGFPFETLYALAYGKLDDAVRYKWAKAYDLLLDRRVRDFLAGYFADATLIFFEASPNLLNIVNELGQIYINFRTHPLRFGRDLIMACQSNCPKITERLKRIAISPETIARETQIFRQNCQSRAGEDCDGVIVFLGQCRYDASVILNGRFLSIDQVSEHISKIGNGRTPFHKPHPHDANEEAMAAWKKIFPNSQPLDIPTYSLFVNGKNMQFTSISSGATYEAELFGHDCYCVSPNNWLKNSEYSQNFNSLLYEYWFLDFWKWIFFGENFESLLDFRNFSPDRLRKVIKTEWAQRHF